MSNLIALRIAVLSTLNPANSNKWTTNTPFPVLSMWAPFHVAWLHHYNAQLLSRVVATHLNLWYMVTLATLASLLRRWVVFSYSQQQVQLVELLLGLLLKCQPLYDYILSTHVRLATFLASKWEQPYSSTMGWLWCRLSFSLIWSSIQAVRGARSSAGRFETELNLPVNLMIKESVLDH